MTEDFHPPVSQLPRQPKGVNNSHRVFFQWNSTVGITLYEWSHKIKHLPRMCELVDLSELAGTKITIHFGPDGSKILEDYIMIEKHMNVACVKAIIAKDGIIYTFVIMETLSFTTNDYERPWV